MVRIFYLQKIWNQKMAPSRNKSVEKNVICIRFVVKKITQWSSWLRHPFRIVGSSQVRILTFFRNLFLFIVLRMRRDFLIDTCNLRSDNCVSARLNFAELRAYACTWRETLLYLSILERRKLWIYSVHTCFRNFHNNFVF